jgi:cytochrome c oxidase subunit II
MKFAHAALFTLLAAQAFDASAAVPGAVGPRQVREFAVIAERFEFIPDRIEVDQGDHVRIIVRSADGTHGFTIRKLGVHREIPRSGEPVTIEFDADRAGTFRIACSEYCGRGHSRMCGTLVVNPPGGNR